ncbi:MAG: FtsB family cell division protein [Candidatus Heimdallarchaeaceae archaeon]
MKAYLLQYSNKINSYQVHVSRSVMSSNTKYILPIVALVIGLGLGYVVKPSGVPHEDYIQVNEQLANALEVNSGLEQEVEDLEDEIAALNEYQDLYVEKTGEYNELLDDWNSLVDDWNQLVDEWDELVVDYNSLSANYTTASTYQYYWETYVDGPVDPIQIPDTDLVEGWLVRNEIDDFSYHDNFKCADFAILLSYYGRKSFWNMGVIGIHGHDVDTSKEYHHAINVLNTTEGIVYIEPQLDDLWWYPDHMELSPGKVWNINGQQIFIDNIEIMADY